MLWIPPPVLFAILVVGAYVSSDLGYRLGRRVGPRDEAFDHQLGIVRGATFAMVAFLIGFAFSGAASRYVERLDIIVKEANALGTAWLRADTLPEPSRGQLRGALRDYAADRVEALRQSDVEPVVAHIARANTFHARIWKAGIDGTAGNPALALLVLPALNEVIDLHTTHLSASKRHLPVAILVGVLITAGLSLGLAAFGHGQIGRRFAWLDLLYGVVLAAALWMTIDLDYPRYGLIRASIDPLIETLGGMRGL
ncbi:MAG: DUF4239 domain-containing protein [Proteobacteria bacterium]|nr:DUF4239 domain-containing protein [Pseudomonadota bacterium]